MIERRTFLIRLTELASLVLLGVVREAGAHGGHEVIPEEQAITRGRELMGLLVDRGKLSPGWAGAPVESTELRLVDDLEQWHLVFRNDAEADPARRALHVFLNYDGQFLGANFSGVTADGG